MSENKHPLLGRKISAIHLAEDKQAIRFDLDSGVQIVAHCDGDCCSVTWIENIENPEAIIDSEVTLAEDIDMPDLGDMPNREVVAYYGFKIETAKGTCVIDFRNESNGYYGGSLSWPNFNDGYYYGGVFGQNESKEVWNKIA